MKAGRKSLNAISEIEGVITPFDICSAGSKPESKFPLITGTTNHYYCPSLKHVLGNRSQVPKSVQYIPEIVINGVNLRTVKKAMKVGIEAISKIKGVYRISAGNYEGKLGKYKIFLRDLFK